MMKRSSKWIVASAFAVASIATGAGVATAAGGTDDAERTITGSDLDRASAAALAHTGQGSVSDTEVGDEDSYYEVEVTLDNGSQVDVQLDEGFNVVDSNADVESETDED
ncbi:hypothetical protein BH18ACT1_BH18ACT1_02440 [soil metagenome]